MFITLNISIIFSIIIQFNPITRWDLSEPAEFAGAAAAAKDQVAFG